MTTEKRRILVVDDEPQITRVLRTALASRGYDVRVASDGEGALDMLGAWPADLVVTDLSMPNMDGLALCRRIRASSDVPIVVLSVKGEEGTKVEALDAGADDYVTKPFGMDELMARVRAALRRSKAAEADASDPVLDVGDFHADFDARAISVRGRQLRLTPKEYDLLAFLIRNAGKVLTHRALLSAVWGDGYVSQVEYLRVFVRQLRRKVEEDPSRPRYVVTEPWTGYRFDPDGTDS